MNGQSLTSLPSGDDTIELQLTPEQLLGLSQAAEQEEPLAAQVAAAEAASPVTSAYAAPQPLFKTHRSSHFWGWRIAKMVGVIVAYIALAWWSSSQLAGQPHASVASAQGTVRAPVHSLRPMPTASNPVISAVRIANPFDAREVFEFPAGTSRAEGHEKVAQILLQRARARQSLWDRTKPEVNLRTADLYAPP